ncbi:MAG TPA: hypothetical protein VK783_13050 [Bacteroidia bacterium]|jgi:hypothetical protein|nr:hypothetical protein [Bacteroidia bacterium]
MLFIEMGADIFFEMVEKTGSQEELLAIKSHKDAYALVLKYDNYLFHTDEERLIEAKRIYSLSKAMKKVNILLQKLL